MVHQFTPMRWVIRTRDGVPGIPEAVREAVRVQDPRRPFRRFIEMEQIIGRDVGVHRFLTMMLSIFACLAVSLAAIGLYALISQLVSQRRHEIGIRLTLGATGSRIVRIFMTEALGLTALGVALGLVAAPSLTAVMEMFLVGVTPLDTVTFVAVPALLLTTTIVATSIPARRAALTDPAMSLRSE